MRLITPMLRRLIKGDIKPEDKCWITQPAGTYVNIDCVATLVLAVSGSPLIVRECIVQAR